MTPRERRSPAEWIEPASRRGQLDRHRVIVNHGG